MIGCHILTGTLDMKHLPHRVAMFYRQLSQSFFSLLLSLSDTETVTTSVTDTVLFEVHINTTIKADYRYFCVLRLNRNIMYMW